MTGISFADVPAIGTQIVLDDQSYSLRAVEPYSRKDGAQSVLLAWLTTCPSCNVAFELKTGLVTKALNRRCGNCRKPRATVSGKSRKARVSVKVVPA